MPASLTPRQLVGCISGALDNQDAILLEACEATVRPGISTTRAWRRRREFEQLDLCIGACRRELERQGEVVLCQ